MSDVPHSDALVFFGATGDLVYKKIFPNLYAMERRGHLQVPGQRRREALPARIKKGTPSHRGESIESRAAANVSTTESRATPSSWR